MIIDNATRRIHIDVDDEVFDSKDYLELGILDCSGSKYFFDDNHFSTFEELREYVTTSDEVAAYLPVYLLDHSVIRISTYPFNDKWDSTQVGYIYTTKERIKKLQFDSLESIKDALRTEIEDLDVYLNAESYCVAVEENGEVIESCCGFFSVADTKDFLLDNLNDSWKELIDKIQI